MTHEWRECPRCQYPMVQWKKFQKYPEQVWINWNPEEWPVPAHFLLLGGLILLALAVPWLGNAIFGGHQRRGLAFGLLETIGLGIAVVIGYMVYLYRTQKRQGLSRSLQANDWVCPKCLHTERKKTA